MSNHPHMRPNGSTPPVQQPIQIEVPPGPVNTQWVVHQVEAGGKTSVMIQFFTPTGMFVVFFPNDSARKMGAAIISKATDVVLG